MFIKEFNNTDLITILGQAVSDIAELGLREIAKTIKNLQIEEKNQNRTFVNNQKKTMIMSQKKILEGMIMEKINYTKMGDYNIPNLVMEKEILPDGKYAKMRLHYLKTEKKAEYRNNKRKFRKW